MNRLLQRLGISRDKYPAGALQPGQAAQQPFTPGRYDIAALGVECAWPVAAEREVRSPAP